MFRASREPLGYGQSRQYKTSLICSVDVRNTGAAEVFDEFGEGHPMRGVHVQVVLVLNIFLMDSVGLDTLCAKSIVKNS